MFKKFNILLALLLLFISITAVSAVEDGNMTEIESNDVIQDVLEMSVDDDIVSSPAADNAVSVVAETNMSASSYQITSSNYGKYFSSAGELPSNTPIKSGDTIVLNGDFSGNKFVFNIPIHIVGGSSNNMKNVMFTLKEGASGSTITGLNIANTKAETYGIFLNAADNCAISDCVVTNTGRASYCICVANGANYNNVTGNRFKAYGVTYGHGTRSTPPVIVSGSHYNYVADNYVEADDANGIYLSSYAGGPLNGGESNYNVIYNNTVKCNEQILPTSWSYLIQVMGSHNTIEANTLIRGYRGISTSGTGNIIINNKIYNITGADYNHVGVETGGEYAIVGAYDSIIRNNIIDGAKIISTAAGISALDGSVVENNWVNVSKVGRGIAASGSNVVVKNNTIFTVSGSGIHQKDEGKGLWVENNIITSQAGVGILIEKLSKKRMPSNVTVIGNTIVTGNKVAIDASGVEEDTSVIGDAKSNIVADKLIILPSGTIDPSRASYIYNGKTITITPANMHAFIDANGGLTSEIQDGDILNFEGTFDNQVIYINKEVKLTGKNPIFYNSTFKVTSSSVLIENLTIINKEVNRVNAWGIFVNEASGVRIKDNNIYVSDPKAAYAIYVLNSVEIEVLNNVLTSEGDFLTFTLLSYASDNCIFTNNTIKTIGTGEVYSFAPEKCIDGNELVIDGKSYCIDGNELVIDGRTYCIDGNELVIDGQSYCIDGNEIVIGGQSYCIDGEEIVIDGKSYCIDGNELVIDGTRYSVSDNEININGTTYCIDGEELVINGRSYCIDGNELVIDGKSYCIDGNELVIDGRSYCIDGSELVIDGRSYCVDGNELVIDGKSYGSEYSTSNAHVVSEIYQTYGILLLYSSNILVSGNDVNVTSKLADVHATTGEDNSTNSIVGIDIYFNSHNNTVSNNNIYIKSKDNYIYGMGVLGYNTGHSAPVGQGATNTVFEGNTITLEGPYFATGVIVGSDSEGTIIKDNSINLKSEGVNYGITLEFSNNSTIENNELTLNSELIYGIDMMSSDNTVRDNIITANAKQIYSIIVSNGKNNLIASNKINAVATGENLSFKLLDSLGSGNAGIYLRDNSTNNQIVDNNITCNHDYAILIGDVAVNNVISNNYLVCENRIGNAAINNTKNNKVSDNYKYIATAKSDVLSAVYLGTGEFEITFDKALDGAVVKFYDNDGNYFAQSKISNGVATAQFKFDSTYTPAYYIFSAVLSKEDYKASKFDLRTNIINGNIIITVPLATIEQGTTGNVVAKLVDEFGNPVKGATVVFNRISSAGRATPMGNAKTDASGIATLSYNVDDSLTVGSYNITADAKNVDCYNDAGAVSDLIVTEKVVLKPGKSSTVYYGNTVAYKVRLVDANGKSVGADKAIVFKINGKTKTVKTDKNGYASYSVKLAAGSYTITAQFNTHKVSNKITFKPTVITKNLSKKKAKTIKFTAKVVDKKGKILKNKKVTFKIKNKKYTAKTNKKGIATLSLKNYKVGKYTITSSYGGCTVKNTIQIKK
ncbi:right-handed parallel beta-helix repeat-containing protein [Methanobrevibacter sp.]|uniref:right-handed parallel beta-helix repeat-containing protein n=1 Tax=Methanobrevibacter sp. TaxID=66852 RepID=UPI003890EE1D